MAGRSGTSRIKALFNIGKKFVDVLDDLWSFLRGSLPADLIQRLTPFILGGVGFITHLGEGIQGAKLAYRAYKDKKESRQRKTRLASSLLITLLAGAGLGLALSLVASTFGAAVSGAAIILAPALIPGSLGAIYSLSLWRKGYIFYKAREKEAEALRAYNEERERWENSPHNEFGGPRPKALQEKYECYAFFREQRLREERKVAFNIVEVLASIMVVTSTVIGTSAIIGASVASFGALPAALLIIGVVAGVACKALEHFDKKYDYRFSRGMRDWFLNQWDRLAHFFAGTPAPTPRKTAVNSFLHRRLGEEKLIEIEMVDMKKQQVQGTEPPEEKSSPCVVLPSPRDLTPSPERSPSESSSSPSPSPSSIR
jgi:hypothetical protein